MSAGLRRRLHSEIVEDLGVGLGSDRRRPPGTTKQNKEVMQEGSRKEEANAASASDYLGDWPAFRKRIWWRVDLKYW